MAISRIDTFRSEVTKSDAVMVFRMLITTLTAGEFISARASSLEIFTPLKSGSDDSTGSNVSIKLRAVSFVRKSTAISPPR